MKVIVTGGAGFIGSHLVDRLLHEGHQVMILDDFSTGNREFVNKKAEVKAVDITNPNDVIDKFKPDVVFHLAAKIDLRESFRNRAVMQAVNVAGSMRVINDLKTINAKKIFFSSSAAVYGDNQNLPVKESEQIRAISPYGEQKAEVERALKSSGIPSIILRYANVYGPRQGTVGEGGVVAIFCKKLLANEPLVIFGSGEQTRDFTFVDDVVESNVLALRSDKTGVVYNVATGVATSINNLAKLLLQISGKNVEIKYIAPAPGDVARSALDNALIKQELGWETKVALEEGLKKTWSWFRNNM